ncbi:MAG: hypothetical protein WB987_16560 [Candidatus Acidiferrales bacterium]
MLRLAVFVLILGFGVAAQAQDTGSVERVYKHSKVEVEQALQSLQAYATNRLPVLDGFANANAGTLTKFENPHYQFRIDIDSQAPGQTLVSIAAKITAWSADSDAARSQYVVIPSNGRLEQDMLDRLSVFLEKGSVGRSPEPPAESASSSIAPAVSAPETPPSGAGSAPLSEHSTGSPPPGAAPALASRSTSRVNPSDPASLASEIAAIQAQRQQSERNQRKLQQQISELQANARTQKYLSNLAVVKAPQTPVFQQDDDTSKVLFRADPEDEFEVITVKDTWFHVRLENGGDGWLRASQLQRPQEVDDAEDAAAALNFTTPNQEIKSFAGDWAALKGKPALFVFAQPSRAIPSGILGQSQLQFAKHVFTEGYREAVHSEQPMSGVVVVFLGDKGGVAAATLADIRRWRDGAISDRAFLERCSLDPPESFRDVPAGAAVTKH